MDIIETLINSCLKIYNYIRHPFIKNRCKICGAPLSLRQPYYYIEFGDILEPTYWCESCDSGK